MGRIDVSATAWLCWCSFGLPLACDAAEHVAPPLMRAERYEAADVGDLTKFWVSEKLDGVRAYWNGHQLLTRAGNVIAAPPWFTAGWPTTALDGELWGGRGKFEQTSGTVRRDLPVERDWRALRFMAFDLPADPDPFARRLSRLNQLVTHANVQWLAAVAQFRVTDAKQLQVKLLEIERSGGEGLMLHHESAQYLPSRTDQLLKMKSRADAEATVIAHLPGQGKYAGKMGALLLERPDGLRFRVGSGFTDAQRSAPPPVGTIVTYEYNGETRRGIPRFARFVRVRSDMDTADSKH